MNGDVETHSEPPENRLGDAHGTRGLGHGDARRVDVQADAAAAEAAGGLALGGTVRGGRKRRAPDPRERPAELRVTGPEGNIWWSDLSILSSSRNDFPPDE